MKKKKGTRLHYLISLLIVAVVISAVMISGFISIETQRNTLTKTYLDDNFNYAKKLAESTDSQLTYMQSNLISLANFVNDDHFKQKDLSIWHRAHINQFNTVFFADEEAVIQFITPAYVDDDGVILMPQVTLDSPAVDEAIQMKRPLISSPYSGTRNDLIILVSSPVYTEENREYMGVLGGTISLEKNNVLQNTLMNHQYNNDSYVYVIDEEGQLIYHPNRDFIGADATNVKAVQQLQKGQSGSIITDNHEGIKHFAGFAHVPNTNWGIVVQTPVSVMEDTLKEFIWKTAYLITPFLLVILTISWFLVSKITKPINELISYTKKAQTKTDHESFIPPYTNSNIYEVKQLYNHMNDYLALMNEQANIDGLTGILNRRVLNNILDEYIQHHIPFHFLMIDIDFFKKVNDEYGHLIGDDVIRHLAKQIQEEITYAEGKVFRFGGEEFSIIIPSTDEQFVYELAESLRTTFARTPNPTQTTITLSIGITFADGSDEQKSSIIKRADLALYHSKNKGRNQTSFYRASMTKP